MRKDCRRRSRRHEWRISGIHRQSRNQSACGPRMRHTNQSENPRIGRRQRTRRAKAMTVHLIVDPEGRVFGLYKDRILITQKQWVNFDDLLLLLGIPYELVVFSEAEMKALGELPATVDEIPIDGLLAEGATIESIQTAAQVKEN